MAGKLILSFNDQEVGEYELDKESLIIGRRPESDIHIDNLAVSGQHARIMTIAGDSFLEDLDSTNGTFVNGKRVKKHPSSPLASTACDSSPREAPRQPQRRATALQKRLS